MPRHVAAFGISLLLLVAWPRSSAGARRPTPVPVTLPALVPAAPPLPGLAAAWPTVDGSWPSPLARGGADALTRALEVRGGAASVAPWSAGRSFDVDDIHPLLAQVSMPLRVGLMSWAVYDKIWQSLKIVTPTPVLHHTAEHLMLVGGLEVEALKTMMVLIDKQRVRHLSSRAKRSLFAASKQLAADIKLAIEVLADFALSITTRTFQEAVRSGKVVSIADEVEVEVKTRGSRKAKGKAVHLSRRALSEAAALDVTRELIPDTPRAEAKITLLGLVASLCHEAVFEKVQLRMLPPGSRRRLITIEEFKAMQGINSAADLVKRMVHKYRTPTFLMNAYLALYTATELRVDPAYYQVAWGMRLGALVGKGLSSRRWVSRAGNALLATYSVFEAQYRLKQLLDFSSRSVSEFGLGAFDHLRATHAFLTVILFVKGGITSKAGQSLVATLTGRLPMNDTMPDAAAGVSL